MTKPVDVVAFIHSYARDGEIGSYMSELVEGFVAAGIRLHLIQTNHLVGNLGNTGYKPGMSDEKVAAYINSVRPAFVFTTNRGGITRRIMAGIDCPIVTWMVDRIPFLHHGGGHDDLFSSKDYVITSSFNNINRLETIYPVLKGRVTFLPFATNANDFAKKADRQDINISFVGTYFYCGLFSTILKTYRHHPKIRDGLIELTARVRADYDLDFPAALQACGVQQVLGDFHLDMYKFKGLLANLISVNDRVQALDALSDLGLKLYGTQNWENVSQYSMQLLRCYQFDTFIKTREQLVDVYQRSKVAFNISHHQAVDGLPYRIFDIMASDALLLTNHRENSDLYRLFGKDMPVPMYKDPAELRRLTIHYLEHEDERLSLVERCNKLMRDDFSFETRARQFLDIVGVAHPKGSGALLQVDVEGLFYTPSLYQTLLKAAGLSRGTWLVRIARRMTSGMVSVIVRLTTRAQRQRLRSILRSWLPASLLRRVKRLVDGG